MSLKATKRMTKADSSSTSDVALNGMLWMGCVMVVSCVAYSRHVSEGEGRTQGLDIYDKRSSRGKPRYTSVDTEPDVTDSFTCMRQAAAWRN